MKEGNQFYCTFHNSQLTNTCIEKNLIINILELFGHVMQDWKDVYADFTLIVPSL